MAVTVDLHLHTLASDGRLSPTELVKMLAAQGLKTVSISDHDTTDGLAEAFQAAEEFPDLRIIPGIELSTDIPGDEIHMLGYFLQYHNEEFQAILRRFREGRLERGRLMVEKLATLGLEVEWERVQEIAGDGSVGRPHVALALVEKGYFKEPREAFAEHLGRNGLAYVEREKMTPTEGVRMLAQVGGVAVLAHPAYMVDLEGNIEELKAAGLVGMEVHYAQYSPETVRYLADLADRYDLIPCGGSDYH
ncbi:MAG: PHP domain-containing protein, partial [Dehalococcoidia bacterium]